MSYQQPETPSKDSFENPQKSAKYLGLVLVLSVILAIASFRIEGVPNFSGIDGSFEWALNVLVNTDLKYGKDIVSTFGPLGFLVSPMPMSNNIDLSNLILCGNGVLFGLAVAELLYAVRSQAKALGFFCFCYGAVWICPSADYRIMLTFLTCILGSFLSFTQWRQKALFVAAALLAAVVVFIKFNIGVICCLSLLVAIFIAMFSRDARILAAGLWSLLAFIGALTGLSICLLGSLPGLWIFIARCVEVASPYSQSMSSYSQDDLKLGAALAFMLSAFILAFYNLLNRNKLVVPLAFMAIALFFSFKHAFIRVGNIFKFPFVALLLLGFAILFTQKKQEQILLVVMALLLIPFFTDLPEKISVESILQAQPLVKGLSGVASLCNLSSFEARLSRITESNYAEARLPEHWLKKMRGATAGIDCVPFNLFLCPANKLKWCPAPVTQLYIAHQPDLDRWTAEHFCSSNRPDFLIAEFPDVDWRHPFFTCPISWRAIFRNYKTVELSPKGQLLLERRERPLVETLKTMTRQNFGVGEWVPVPRAPQYVLARISLRKTFLGKLRELLYRTDPVFIDLAYINGTYSHFRMVPLQAENGILLSCLPSAIDGFKDLFLLTPKQRVAYFLITGPGTKSFNKCCQVEFDDASYH